MSSKKHYVSVAESILRIKYPNFDPKNQSPEEKGLYICAFIEQVSYDNLAEVEKYLEYLNLDEVHSKGYSVLQYCKSVAMTRLLLENGANLFFINKNDGLPIEHSYSVYIFKYLLMKMREVDPNSVADLNDRLDRTGMSFFHTMIAFRTHKVVEWLIEDECHAKELGFSTPNLFEYADDDDLDTMQTAIMTQSSEKIISAIYPKIPKNHNYDDLTWLMLCIINKCYDGVTFFGKNLKDIEQYYGPYSVTALMFAATMVDIESCKLLLNLGADPNKKCGKNIHSVASSVLLADKLKFSVNEKLTLLELLKERGANFRETFDDGNILLSLSIEEEPEIFEFFASQADPSSFSFKSKEGLQLIHLACKKNKNLKNIMILFKYAPKETLDVNTFSAFEFEKMTPLAFAARNGDRDTCLFLLNSGANPDIKCGAGYKASHFAKSAGHNKLADELKGRE